MTLSIAVVCESPADQRTGCDLADRVFCAEVDWIEQELLVHLREWRGLKRTDCCLLWKDAPQLGTGRGYWVSGFFQGKPGDLDARATRRALRLLLAADAPPDAVVLLRDDDGKTARRNGMEQAVAESGLGRHIAIGLAHTMRECWVLAGFDPVHDEEAARLAGLCSELGFNPCQKAERLTAAKDSAKRSPKRVLNVLVGGDPDREAHCWQKTDIHVLESRGKGSGLTKYLEEVSKKIKPLLTPSYPSS